MNKLYYNTNETAEYLTSAFADSKFRVNSLNPTINRYFESALPLIHSDSFPLKTLKTTVIGLDTYAHPVIMHAETLILIINTFNEAISLSNIKNLANKTVIVDEQCNTSREYNIFELVKCLRNGQKPIGTTYIFSSYFADIKNLLSKMFMAWRRFSDQLNDMEERYVDHRENNQYFLFSADSSLMHRASPSLWMTLKIPEGLLRMELRRKRKEQGNNGK